MRELIRQLCFPNQQARLPLGPRSLFITCSDLPINPYCLTRSQPDTLHLLCNAGNIVPPYEAESDGQTATLRAFANDPQVRKVIVCGHTPCVVLKRLLRPGLLSDLPAVADWLRHADDARRLGSNGQGPPDERRALFELAAATVLIQLENLRTLPGVATRLAVGDLALSGWLYERETGTLFGHDPVADRFVPIVGPASPDA